MATGPHNVSPAAYPALPTFSPLPADAKSPLPRLMAPPSQADFFLRPPPSLVTSSNGMPSHRDPPALLSGMFPPLGFMGPLTSQFDPSAAAAAAAMAVAGTGKLSPTVQMSVTSNGDFPGAAAAAAAAAMQAASLKIANNRPQRPLPPLPYEKLMPSVFFPRPEGPGVPPPLGVRPQGMTPAGATSGPPCDGLFPPCSSHFGGGTPAGKLPSPVLPHAANRTGIPPAPKSESGEKCSVDTVVEKSPKEITTEKSTDGSNTVSEAENGCISSNDVNSISDGSIQPPNNNNNCSPSKISSKGSGDFSFDDKNQTEDEVQKLMSIALSNNQKRLERACLNATDKPNVNRIPSSDDTNKNVVAKSIDDDAETNREISENSLSKEEGSVKEENLNDSTDEIKIHDEIHHQEEKDEKLEYKAEITTEGKDEASKVDESKSEFCVPEDRSNTETERPSESGRLSVESDESMTSSNVEQLVANAQPDKEGWFFCHLCDFTGNTRSEFQDHMNWHYDFRCPKCDYTSRTEGRLNRHIRDFHSEIPPLNFSGKVTRANKPKTHKCKQCNYVAITKTDFWAHARTHIKDDKILECPKCDFVTEYKHHLEYHIRNHFGSKPYKCEKCNYECVNKSMLNSHMKSHTNVYQYRCADCQYATKYCHSLKLHLGKYAHRPATILNSDGSLPEYDNSSDILNIKRGPPRGSRLQRLGPEPGSGVPSGGVSMGSSPAPPQPLPFLQGSPMNPLWSLPMAHQTAGLFPGLPNMPPSFLTQNPLCPGPQTVLPPPYVLPSHTAFSEEPLRSAMAPPPEEAKAKEASLEIHCNFCEHRFDTRDALVKHMLQNHRNENTDLFGASLLSSFVPDNMAVMREVSSGVHRAAPPPDVTAASSDALDLRSSKKAEADAEAPYETSLGSFFKRSIAQVMAAQLAPEEEEEPTAKRQRSREASPACQAASDAPAGRKRPRKSKAFRLEELPQPGAASPENPELAVKSEAAEECEEVAGDGRMDESCDSSAMNSLEVADRELEALAQRQECHHCNIIFRDRTMFEMHMGYHGYGNPFKCNRCGHTSPDSVQFFIHLCQMAHS